METLTQVLIIFSLFISIHSTPVTGPGDITTALYDDILCTVPVKITYVEGTRGECAQTVINGATRYSQTTCNSTHTIAKTFTQAGCTDIPTIEVFGSNFFSNPRN
jgi:hypothetical protein